MDCGLRTASLGDVVHFHGIKCQLGADNSQISTLSPDLSPEPHLQLLSCLQHFSVNVSDLEVFVIPKTCPSHGAPFLDDGGSVLVA